MTVNSFMHATTASYSHRSKTKAGSIKADAQTLNAATECSTSDEPLPSFLRALSATGEDDFFNFSKTSVDISPRIWPSSQELCKRVPGRQHCREGDDQIASELFVESFGGCADSPSHRDLSFGKKESRPQKKHVNKKSEGSLKSKHSSSFFNMKSNGLDCAEEKKSVKKSLIQTSSSALKNFLLQQSQALKHHDAGKSRSMSPFLKTVSK